ncbi:MAG: DNA cytosine methyltransferase [Chroococcidiopsidaceae cyanobacterium CP_BM_RX_35]|nr:DNA cytosine methyltransferase [Chroococcidiopsidaceae cyanobacterium CP_BM_RX_35]
MVGCQTVIDLFCGCGGFSTGLLDVGLAVKGGFDSDVRAIAAYNYNHSYRGAQGLVLDLAKANGHDLLNVLQLNSVDLLIGGPPCQAFSIVGSRQGLADPRGQLIFDFVRFVAELRPTAFILENVPNLQTISNGQVYQQLIDRFRALEYNITYGVLSAADYGVPQNRKRLFTLGTVATQIAHFPPAATHFPPATPAVKLMHRPLYRTCQDVLEDLPDVTSPAAAAIPNHEPTQHTKKALQELANLAPGKRSKKYFYDRLHPERPSYTLRAGAGNFTPLRPIHYRYDRVISVRESARLQGFSDNFIWPDTIPRLQQYRQVGNAVCPPIAAALGQFICELLGWEHDPAQFVGNSASRPSAFTKSQLQKETERLSRIRGASLGLGPTLSI